ncbi:MAG: sortase [Acidimicrobiia bacterium]|nr:sortase [Acidimicrobiia bacterium]
MTDVLETEQDSSDHPHDGGARRAIRIFGWTTIGFGLFLLGFVGHQLFVTTYFAQQANEGLTEEVTSRFADVEISEVPYLDPTIGSTEPTNSTDPSDPFVDPEVRYPTLLVEAPPDVGEPFAIITIPSIPRLAGGWAVVEGVSRKTLRAGAGHMPSTPLPGQPGNSVISGHRTTYGAPFHELDMLKPGDLIEVETALGVHTYRVTGSEIVSPRDLWVTEDRGGATLTLTTCHPKFSSRQRLVVFAELIDGPNAPAILGT